MAPLPEQISQNIRVREQLGEVLIVVTEKQATETDAAGIDYLYISEKIISVTGYRASELIESGLRLILPENWKDKHELIIQRELAAIRTKGPAVKIMGEAGGNVRTVAFAKKSGSAGSLVLPLYGYLIDEIPYIIGIVNEVSSPIKHIDYPSENIDCFLSYGRSDFIDSNFPDELVKLLQDQNINAWLDSNDIPLASSDFMHVIKTAIAHASLVLFVAAPNSVCSPYCAEELKIARDLGKQILVILYRRQGTVSLSQDSWNYLYPEGSDQYSRAVAEGRHVKPINTETLLKQFQPGLSQSNWLIWDNRSFAYFIPKIKKVINKDKEAKEKHTELLLKALEWSENGESMQFLLSQSKILDAQQWLQKPGPNEVIELISRYISDSSQVRSGNFADVFICHDIQSIINYEELIYGLQVKGLSTWNDKHIFEIEEDEKNRYYQGITRSANVVFIVSRTSINNDFCQAQISYAKEQNKPIFLALVTPGIKSELPDYLRLPAVDLTDSPKQAISKLSTDLKDGLDHKRVLAKLAAQAQKNWNTNTKIPLNPEQLSTAIAYIKRGKYSDRYRPSPLVSQMLEFSLAEKQPFWMRVIPWIGSSGVVTGLILVAALTLRPTPIPKDLSEIRDWDFSLSDIERQTGIPRDRIFQCAKELKEGLPLSGTPGLQPISSLYAFAYEYDEASNIVGRTIVCQATGVDPTKGIPRWIFNVSIRGPGYQKQLAAHLEGSRCFAAFNANGSNEDVISDMAGVFQGLNVAVEGIEDKEAFKKTILSRTLVRSEFGLIVSCPAQTIGSPDERRLGSYVSAAILESHLRSVDPATLISLVMDKANSTRTTLQIPPPEVLEKQEIDYDFRVALFIKAAAIDGEVDDPIQRQWVNLIEDTAEDFNSVIDLYDLPCQKCHLDQIVDLQHIVTEDNPPDGLIVAASNSLLIGAALKDISDRDIPIVAFDTEVDNPNLLAYVGPDNEALAYKVARWGVNKAAEGKAFIVNGPLVQKNARDREQGFLRAIAENPLIENAGSGAGDWSEESGYNLAIDMLESFPDARLFLCANDRMAMGVARAAEELGRRGQLIVTGFDYLNPDVLDKIDATISQGSAEQAQRAADIMFQFLRRGRTPSEAEIIFDQFEVISREI